MPEAPNIDCRVVFDALHDFWSKLNALSVEALSDLSHILVKAHSKVKASDLNLDLFAWRQFLSFFGLHLFNDNVLQADVPMNYSLGCELL